MDPVAATAAAYGAETAVEGAVGAYFISKPTLPLKARLLHVSPSSPIPRSSHSLTVIGDKAYIFGGEIEPREPVSNNVEVLQLSATEPSTATAESIPAKAEYGSDDVPAARVGHTAVAARNLMFVFGGRGGAEMTALPENGRLWVFDPSKSAWLYLDPPPETYSPAPRSYHSMTASSEGNAVYIHAGCGSDGTRLSDTWAFYLDEGKWTRLADAPGPPRGGTSITYGQGRLWRFGGFDGNTELGGQLDSLDLPSPRTLGGPGKDIDDDAEWRTIPFDFSTTEASSKSTIPAPRSLAALQFVTTGQGRDYLLLALGEGDPSKSGHAGAGKFFHDIWAYQLSTSSAFSGAGIKDVILDKLPGTGSMKGQWAEVEVTKLDVESSGGGTGATDEKNQITDKKREIFSAASSGPGGEWTGRGWFDSAMTGTKQFLIWGGIDETNERLGDGWMVVIE